MKITESLLHKHGACADQIKLFVTTFPDGTEATPEAILEAAKAGLQTLWLERLIPTNRLLQYNAAKAPIGAQYDAAMARTRAQYRKAMALLDAQYNAARAPIDAQYNAARAPILSQALNT